MRIQEEGTETRMLGGPGWNTGQPGRSGTWQMGFWVYKNYLWRLRSVSVDSDICICVFLSSDTKFYTFLAFLVAPHSHRGQHSNNQTVCQAPRWAGCPWGKDENSGYGAGGTWGQNLVTGMSNVHIPIAIWGPDFLSIILQGKHCRLAVRYKGCFCSNRASS